MRLDAPRTATNSCAVLTTAGQPVDHRQRRAGVIDKHAFAGDMALAHGRYQPRLPVSA